MQAPVPSQQDWVARAPADSATIAAGGRWRGSYVQYNRFHDINEFSLRFEGGGRVTGNGSDDVGRYDLSGSVRGAYLALSKKYIAGTGNRTENKGHTVQLRLQYKQIDQTIFAPSTHEMPSFFRTQGIAGSWGFHGSWHVRTSSYSGNGEQVLWLVNDAGEFNAAVGQPQPSAPPLPTAPAAAAPALAQAVPSAPPQPPPSPSAPPPKDDGIELSAFNDASRAGFAQGERVEVHRLYFDRWFAGNITGVNGDGTVAVAYDDGDTDERVDPSIVRRAATSLLGQLNELSAMHAAGQLTDAEFSEAKAAVLRGGAGSGGGGGGGGGEAVKSDGIELTVCVQ